MGRDVRKETFFFIDNPHESVLIWCCCGNTNIFFLRSIIWSLSRVQALVFHFSSAFQLIFCMYVLLDIFSPLHVSTWIHFCSHCCVTVTQPCEVKWASHRQQQRVPVWPGQSVFLRPVELKWFMDNKSREEKHENMVTWGQCWKKPTANMGNVPKESVCFTVIEKERKYLSLHYSSSVSEMMQIHCVSLLQPAEESQVLCAPWGGQEPWQWERDL